jgi:hypothetical protein
VRFEHAAESLVGPPRNFGDLLVSGGAELVKAQRALVISHVHAIEHEAVKMHVQAQQGVGALDEGDRTKRRVMGWFIVVDRVRGP